MNIRLEEHKLCLLVLIGVRADGRKELIALAGGYRESAESWADLLRDCARRGMRAPGARGRRRALGFWKGLPAGGVPRDPGGPLLVPQDRESAGRATEVGAPGSEEGAGGDPKTPSQKQPKDLDPQVLTIAPAVTRSVAPAIGDR